MLLPSGAEGVLPTRSGAAPRTGGFEVYADRAGRYRWRLRSANGQVVAQGQSYRTRGGRGRRPPPQGAGMAGRPHVSLTRSRPVRRSVVRVQPLDAPPRRTLAPSWAAACC